jgi:hypothetical protein
MPFSGLHGNPLSVPGLSSLVHGYGASAAWPFMDDDSLPPDL